MLRYLEDRLQPVNGCKSLAVTWDKHGVRLVAVSANTGKVCKVLETYHGQTADRQRTWVIDGQ